MSEKQKKEQGDETMNFLGNAGGFVPPKNAKLVRRKEEVGEKDLEKAIFAHLPFSSLCSSTRGEAVLKWGRENAARVCAYTTAKEGGIGSYFRSHFLLPSGRGGIEEMEKSLRRSRILLPFLGRGGENKGFRSLFSSAHSFPLFLCGGKEYRILSSFFPGRFSRRFEGRPDAAKYVFRSECEAAKKRRPRPIPPPPTPGGEKLTAQTNPTSIQGSSRIICHFFPPAKASSW